MIKPEDKCDKYQSGKVGYLMLRELTNDPNMQDADVNIVRHRHRHGPDSDVDTAGPYTVYFFTVKAHDKTTEEIRFFVFDDKTSDKFEWVVECLGVRDTIDISLPRTRKAFLDRIRPSVFMKLS
jgi:hypothetical protein